MKSLNIPLIRVNNHKHSHNHVTKTVNLVVYILLFVSTSIILQYQQRTILFCESKKSYSILPRLNRLVSSSSRTHTTLTMFIPTSTLSTSSSSSTTSTSIRTRYRPYKQSQNHAKPTITYNKILHSPFLSVTNTPKIQMTTSFILKYAHSFHDCNIHRFETLSAIFTIVISSAIGYLTDYYPILLYNIKHKYINNDNNDNKSNNNNISNSHNSTQTKHLQHLQNPKSKPKPNNIGIIVTLITATLLSNKFSSSSSSSLPSSYPSAMTGLTSSLAATTTTNNILSIPSSHFIYDLCWTFILPSSLVFILLSSSPLTSLSISSFQSYADASSASDNDNSTTITLPCHNNALTHNTTTITSKTTMKQTYIWNTIQSISIPFFIGSIGSILGCLLAAFLFTQHSNSITTVPGNHPSISCFSASNSNVIVRIGNQIHRWVSILFQQYGIRHMNRMEAALAAGCLCSSYIGGTVNFFSTAHILSSLLLTSTAVTTTTSTLFSSMAAADLIVMAFYFGIMSLILSSFSTSSSRVQKSSTWKNIFHNHKPKNDSQNKLDFSSHVAKITTQMKRESKPLRQFIDEEEKYEEKVSSQLYNAELDSTNYFHCNSDENDTSTRLCYDSDGSHDIKNNYEYVTVIQNPNLLLPKVTSGLFAILIAYPIVFISTRLEKCTNQSKFLPPGLGCAFIAALTTVATSFLQWLAMLISKKPLTFKKVKPPQHPSLIQQRQQEEEELKTKKVLQSRTIIKAIQEYIFDPLKNVTSFLSEISFHFLFSVIGISANLKDAFLLYGPTTFIFASVALCIHILCILSGSWFVNRLYFTFSSSSPSTSLSKDKNIYNKNKSKTRKKLSDYMDNIFPLSLEEIMIASNAGIGGPATAAAFAGNIPIELIKNKNQNEGDSNRHDCDDNSYENKFHNQNIMAENEQSVKKGLVVAAMVWGIVGYAFGTSIGVNVGKCLLRSS